MMAAGVHLLVKVQHPVMWGAKHQDGARMTAGCTAPGRQQAGWEPGSKQVSAGGYFPRKTAPCTLHTSAPCIIIYKVHHINHP